MKHTMFIGIAAVLLGIAVIASLPLLAGDHDRRPATPSPTACEGSTPERTTT